MYRLPGTVNYNNFPRPNRNGSIFYSKPEFDFVANDVSFNSLLAETCNSMQITPDMLNQQVEMFKNSVNRDPDVFKVPEDGGDAFFKKLNLGLFLKNYGGNTNSLIAKSSTVVDFMQAGFNSLALVAAPVNQANSAHDLAAFQAQPFGPNLNNHLDAAGAKAAVDAIPEDNLRVALQLLAKHYRNNNGARPGNNLGNAAVATLRTTFGVVNNARFHANNVRATATVADIATSIWKGDDANPLDELKIYVTNMMTMFRAAGNYSVGNSVITRNPANVLLNIGERLRTDAFYRERNFKEVLQEAGVSLDEFERLVENAVSVIYWPDCIASKVSDQDLYNLVKGFGLPVDETQGKSKAEICSFILTSLGFRPNHFSGTQPALNTMIGTEEVKLLQQLVRAIRDPKLTAPTEGYLGFSGPNMTAPGAPIGAGHQFHGAYLMTGFAAHNVTAEKAAKWLRATGVDASTQTGFLSYANNQNTFDTMDSRKDYKKIGFTGNMDYTKDMLDAKLVNGTNIGLWQ